MLKVPILVINAVDHTCPKTKRPVKAKQQKLLAVTDVANRYV